MATVAPTSGSALFSPQMLAMLQSLIGSTQDQNVIQNTNNNTNTSQNTTGSQTGTSQQATTGTSQQATTGNQATTGTTTSTGNQATTGTQTQNQTQTGTNNQQTTGSNQTTGSQSVVGTQTGTQTQTTQNLADVSQLMQVFQQQQAGITPDVLASIFSEGAKAAPGLVTATANAVGARSSNNTPLATALTNLNSQLTNSAAQMSLNQRNASAQTAEAIARLTSQQQVTGTNTQQNQQQSTTDQLVNILQSVLGNTTQNSQGTTGTTQNTTNNNTTATNQNVTSNQNTTGSTNQNTTGSTTQNNQQSTTGNTALTGTVNTNNQTDNQVNTGNISNLLGMLAGGTVLNGAIPGGLGAIGGLLQQGGQGIGQLLQSIIGGLGGGGGGASPLPAPDPGFQVPGGSQLTTPGTDGSLGVGNWFDNAIGDPNLGSGPLGGNSITGGFNETNPDDYLSQLMDSLGFNLTGDATSGGSLLNLDSPDFWNSIGIAPETLSWNESTGISIPSPDFWSDQDWQDYYTDDGWGG